ncbi:MAG: CBS domain-containing protein [Candidatus Saccharibacteria bacterium]|nr:MAG: CBS domain-containing protein [Candidatus Saccharibacteria bacterium]
MIVFMVILCIALLIVLIMLEGVMPLRSSLSTFELERRAKEGDKGAIATARREALLGDVLSLRRGLSALFLVLFVITSVATFGWLLGVLIAVFVALEIGAIARISLWQQHVQKLYETHEAAILNFVEKFSGVIKFLRSAIPDVPARDRLDSREELHYLVQHSGGLITEDEKKLITHGLSFDTRTVSEILTPRSVIDTIDKKELLGPLVLDDLHKTGHSRFPVIDGDTDHIIGILHIHDLLTLDSKRSTTAEKAMEARVFYIREDQTLAHALAAFLRTRHHLFIVVNEFRETVGVLSLEDVMEALLGRKIIDEFDAHEDLRAVAARNIRANNHPVKREDV